MSSERIEAELQILLQGGQRAALLGEGRQFVVYYDVPTAGAPLNLPSATDVAVPVPGGYPGAAIDLAGLPAGSPLLGRVKGSSTEVVGIGTRQFQLVSFHPHGNAGGPPWDQAAHGFHTYYDWILTWLDRLT